MLGVVVDARHDVGATEALRVLEGLRRNELSGLERVESHGDRGGPDIERETVSRARLDCKRGKTESIIHDPQSTSPHRVTAHDAIADESGAAGEAKPLAKMGFLRCRRAQMRNTFFDLEKTFAALPLLEAGRGDADIDRFRAVEECSSVSNRSILMVDAERRHGGVYSVGAARASSRAAQSFLKSVTALAASAA